ncbi:Endonuclease/exonuclease/phosphatase superfamily [Sesbania bispinosa]|nr:Endonuclease/exonuclease/phosphatase superfamily [Sesbania bispinosa]
MLWADLKTLFISVDLPWLVMGDINAILHESEKAGGGEVIRTSLEEFRIVFLFVVFLIWDSKALLSLGRNGFRERLDRGVCNSLWRFRFQITHLPSLKSDHHPILMRLNLDSHHFPVQRPFRFLASWMSHSSFVNLVKDIWDTNNHWSLACSEFQLQASRWNREVFGNIFYRKQKLLNRMEGATKRLCSGSNRGITYLLKNLWVEY